MSPNHEKDCVFCKIIRGELPCSKVYENKEFLAFLSIQPINKGHTLIIPKTHCENLLDFPKAEETDLLEFVKKVARAVMKATDADGFNFTLNNGKAAGQAVFHAHFHIIPRYSADVLKNWPHKTYEPGEMEEYCKKISAELK